MRSARLAGTRPGTVAGMIRGTAAARIATIYGVAATVWILLSDRAALALFGDAALLSWVQTVKGLGFVAASAMLILALIRRERTRWLAAEAAERQMAMRYQAVFRASPAGILITDLSEERYEDANDRFLRLSGYRRDDIVGRSVADVSLWVAPAERRALLAELRSKRRLLERTVLLRRADGSVRTMLWSAALLDLGGRERMLTAMVDLTERAEAYEQTLAGWAAALDLRDHETAGHAQRVTELAVALGRRLGVDESGLIALRWGALLHDIGKIGVPDSILNKPGPLDDEEWEVMRAHPGIARELLAPISFLGDAIDVPAHHHERWDGRGYPDGLAGEAIPLAARIFAVVDVWDALRSDRPYRRAWTPEAVTRHLRENAGHHFDPKVAEAFLAMVVAGEVDEVSAEVDADAPTISSEGTTPRSRPGSRRS